MNISQKQSILNSIEQILQFDFDKFITENNKSGNIDEIKFGEYSVSEFKNMYLQVFNQLKEELEKGLGLMLPNQDAFNNEYSSVILDIESGTFYGYLQEFRTKDAAAEILKRFVFYQIRNGFWNKSSVKQHNVDAEKLSEAQQNLLTAQAVLTENIKTFDALKQEFLTRNGEFSQILSEVNAQHDNINNLSQTARSEGTQITDLLTSANNKDAEITAFVSKFQNSLQSINTSILEYEEKFSKIVSENSSLAGELSESLEETKNKLKDSKEGNDYINSQKAEITRLIGMAADGSLGYKFNKRKEDLERGVNNFWRFAVPGSILIALAWVFIIFTVLSAHLGNDWINLLVNLIKTSPAWFLVGFVFTQYSKERDLQEEYAFKSAIAMTLTAYSQMLSEDDGKESANKSSKQEMLLKSIENLYKQPVLRTDKPSKKNIVDPKLLVDSIKNLTDVVKNIKG